MSGPTPRVPDDAWLEMAASFSSLLDEFIADCRAKLAAIESTQPGSFLPEHEGHTIADRMIQKAVEGLETRMAEEMTAAAASLRAEIRLLQALRAQLAFAAASGRMDAVEAAIMAVQAILAEDDGSLPSS